MYRALRSTRTNSQSRRSGRPPPGANGTAAASELLLSAVRRRAHSRSVRDVAVLALSRDDPCPRAGCEMTALRCGRFAERFKAPPRDAHPKLGKQARGEGRGWTLRPSPPDDLALTPTVSSGFLPSGRRPAVAGIPTASVSMTTPEANPPHAVNQPDPEPIPAEFRDREQWVCWRDAPSAGAWSR